MRHPSLVAVAGCAVLAGCSSAAGLLPPPPPPQHLYVGDDHVSNDGSSAYLRSYLLPLTASSRPVVMLPMSKPFLVGVSTNTLAVTGLTGNIELFALPLTANSTFFAAISSESSGTPVFSGGRLYQGGSSSINVYTPPFTSASVPSSSIPTPGVTPSYLAVDPNGTFYATTGANTIGVVTGTSLTTILTAAPVIAFRGLVSNGTRLFACGFNGPADDVFVYTLPLTADAVPAITIDLGDAAPEACVLDASGNLYVGSPDGRILVFTPPFSNASAPALTLTTDAVVYGMAIGP